MTTIYIGLITLFIYGIYEISSIKDKVTTYFYARNNSFLYKLFNCLFCTTFWIAAIITYIYILLEIKVDLLTPVYFAGTMYLIIKVRWL